MSYSVSTHYSQRVSSTNVWRLNTKSFGLKRLLQLQAFRFGERPAAPLGEPSKAKRAFEASSYSVN